MPDRPVGPFELRLPPSAEHVATARLFTASIARAIDMTEDQVDDVRLATSEAVTAAIVAGGASEIVIAGEVTEQGLILRVSPLEQDVLSADHIDVESIIVSLFPNTHFDDGALVIPIQIRSTWS